ncbi:MAG: tetratricopeptide repeat protein [Bryobacteraceae bacterium]|jgi:hypothetical protein
MANPLGSAAQGARVRLAVLFLAALAAVLAQNPAADQEVPPDEKAFRAIRTVINSKEKLTAMQKFVADYPASKLKGLIQMRILTALAQSEPSARKTILNQAKLVFAEAQADEKSDAAAEISVALAHHTPYYAEAVRYAKKSHALLLAEAPFAVSLKKDYAEDHVPVPSPEEIHKRFLAARAYPLYALGYVYLKEGTILQAEPLLKASLDAYSYDPDAWFAYAQAADKTGRKEEARERYIQAALHGSNEAHVVLEKDYKPSNHGGATQLDAMLDARYAQMFPNPLKAEPYRPDEKRTDRVVLAELFTGASCPPCVAADLAFDAAAERYRRGEVAIIAWHQHIPDPDPLANHGTIDRGVFYNLWGTPTWAIDGETAMGNGGNRDNADEVWRGLEAALEKRLDTPPEAHLSLRIDRNGDTIQVDAAPTGVQGDLKDVKLYTVLVEDHVRYVGNNGIRYHGMVARAVSETSRTVFDLATVAAENRKQLDDYEKQKGDFSFYDKPVKMDAARLGIVSFVQDTKTKKVLQSAYRSLNPGANGVNGVF